MPRIGYLWIGAEGSDGDTLAGFLAGLANFGYVDRRTIVIERRYANGGAGRLGVLAAELATLRVDLIVAVGTVATYMACAATRAIPIVSVSGDPVGSGFAASLSRLGGNTTGLTLQSSGSLAGKWVELLALAVPNSSRFALLHGPAEASVRRAVEDAARLKGIEVVAIGCSAARDMAAALATVASSKVSGLIVTDNPLHDSLRTQLIGFAADTAQPAIYGTDKFVPAGGLMSCSASVSRMWRRDGFYLDSILKGADPAELPIEQPTIFEFKLNLKTAQALNLVIPDALVARADEVIE